MAVNNPKPKYINGSMYPNAKMTVTTDGNPYAGKVQIKKVPFKGLF